MSPDPPIVLIVKVQSFVVDAPPKSAPSITTVSLTANPAPGVVTCAVYTVPVLVIVKVASVPPPAVDHTGLIYDSIISGAVPTIVCPVICPVPSTLVTVITILLAELPPKLPPEISSLSFTICPVPEVFTVWTV